MTYSVEINDKSKTGKSLIVFLKSLAQTSKDIQLIEVVEDDAFLREIYIDTLARGEYEVDTASDGDEG